MGLGFSICYPVGTGRKTDKKVYEEFFQNLPSIVPEWKNSYFSDDDGFRVKIVPFEEDIYGQWEDGREINAQFFKNSALYLIWCETVWLPPQTESERETIRAALACLEKANDLDEKLDYPAAEWLELARLTEDTKLIKTLIARFGDTKTALLGYRRGQINSNAGGWRITHDGNMHFDWEEDGDFVWWDETITIRATAFAVEFTDDPPNTSEELLASAIRNEEGYEPFALRNTDIRAAIQHLQIEEDGEPLFQTRLNAALDNQLLVLSLFYPDEADRDLAVKICASAAR